MNTSSQSRPDQENKIRLIIFPQSATYVEKRASFATLESYQRYLEPVPAAFTDRVHALSGTAVEISVARDFDWAALIEFLELPGQDLPDVIL